MALEQPDRYVATMSKAKRSGVIFIDWLRNTRGAAACVRGRCARAIRRCGRAAALGGTGARQRGRRVSDGKALARAKRKGPMAGHRALKQTRCRR
jgi:bifunctional non-homologous end joining protein LigD